MTESDVLLGGVVAILGLALLYLPAGAGLDAVFVTAFVTMGGGWAVGYVIDRWKRRPPPR